MARSYVERVPPGGGANQKIETHRASPLIPGDTLAGDYISELYALRGVSAQLQAVTLTDGAQTVGDYPADGDGLVDAATSTSVTLDASGAAAHDLTGCLVVLLTGAAGVAGQVRRITDYNTGTKVATVATWDVTPAAGNQYAVLVDTEGRSSVFVKAEFATSIGACTVIPVFFDFPRDPSKGAAGGVNGLLGVDGTKRKPRRYYGLPLNLSAIADPPIQNQGTEQAGYYHGAILAQDCRGAIGAKLRLHVIPAGPSKVALYVGST